MNGNLRIGFLLGSPDINGGTYVIFEHGSGLIERGHQVTMLTEQPIDPERYSWHPKAQLLQWQTIDEASTSFFDIIIATWWQSVFILPRLNANHYVYFVQSIESRFFESQDPYDHDNRQIDLLKQYCESTYSLNLPVITEAEWIRSYLYEHYNRKSWLVRNGIRKDIYRPNGPVIAPRNPNKLRVLVEGPTDVVYKNVPKTIELCKQAKVDEIWLLTSSKLTAFPGIDRLFSQVPIIDTPAIYRSCDVLVKLSYIEGMFGPPLEMFHCGGTAIVYDVTGVDEYIEHNTNSYVVAQDHNEQVVKYLKKLKAESSELNRLQDNALKTAASWPDWPSAVDQFEKALTEISSHISASKKYLKSWTEGLIRDNTHRFQIDALERFKAREHWLPDHGTEKDVHNFVQVYFWSETDGFDPEAYKWQYYSSGEQCTLKISVEVTGDSFWVRIDPSVRIGVIVMSAITISHAGTGELLQEYTEPKNFNRLYACGSIQRIGGLEHTAYLSTGDDPQLILPSINNLELGEKLDILISLQEMGVAEYIAITGAADRKRADTRQNPLGRLKNLIR